MNRLFGAISFICALLFAHTGMGQSLEWVRQFGSDSFDHSRAVSADGLGNLYVAGYTEGNVGGPNAGSTDVFVSKYDLAGNVQWTRQLGTAFVEISYGISADSLGNIFVTGSTTGVLDGANAGSDDAFVSKYDSAGSLQWSRQLGSGEIDRSYAAAADGLGNVYITGHTDGDLDGTNLGSSDAFVSKYDTSGTLLWTRQFGTSGGDVSNGVSVDGDGNFFLTGSTNGDLNGTNQGLLDAFVSKFDGNGGHLWTRQLGTQYSDASFSVSADALGNVFITGDAFVLFPGSHAGSIDTFTSKYSSDGSLLWTEYLGSENTDQSNGIAADDQGNAYIVGYTNGSVDGLNLGKSDVIVVKYGMDGEVLWKEQLGTNQSDQGWGISTDGMGNIFISGRTTGDWAGSLGNTDAFVIKLRDQVPEPSTVMLVALAVTGFVIQRRWQMQSQFA